MMADITTTYASILTGMELIMTPCAATQTLKCGRDETETLFVDNTNGGGILTVTIKAGDGIGSAAGDVSFTVAAGKIFVVGGFDGMRVNKLLVNQSVWRAVADDGDDASELRILSTVRSPSWLPFSKRRLRATLPRREKSAIFSNPVVKVTASWLRLGKAGRF